MLSGVEMRMYIGNKFYASIWTGFLLWFKLILLLINQIQANGCTSSNNIRYDTSRSFSINDHNMFNVFPRTAYFVE